MTTRARITFTIGSVMIALGLFIALRPLWVGPQPLSASRWLDMAFAAFFLLRGWMNISTARRQARALPDSREPDVR